MDQLKTAIQFLKVHGFWVVCGLVVLITVSTWFMAAGTLETEAEKQRGDIQRKFTAGQGVVSIMNHPNTASHDRIDQIIQQRQMQVFQAWTEQAAHQQDVLKWDPKLSDEHPAEFAKAQEMRPIEKQRNSDLRPEFRSTYREYVKEMLPRLAERIKANWTPDADSRTQTVGDDNPMGLGAAELVHWDPANQSELVKAHFDWPNQRNGTPDTVQLLYAQEDLWVLSALMSVIEATNGNVGSRREAAIKTIDFIKLGKNVQGPQGKIKLLDAAATSVTEGSGSHAQANTGHAEGDPTQTSSADDPAENRYVDLQYKPLSAARLKSAVGGQGTQSIDDARLAVAKRMPVQMRIVIDQEQMDTFMVECRNSALPLEIRQLRLNPDASTEVRRSTGTDGAGHAAVSQPTDKIDDVVETDVVLEVYGIVNIYNPADRTLLKMKPDETTTASR